MFTSTATVQIIRNPKNIKSDTDFLVTAITCEELSRYYRYLVLKHNYINLLKPGWKSHITISKINPAEKFPVASLFDKREIEFSYEPIVRYSGDTTKDKPPTHWFLDVYSDEIREIRYALGLPDYTKFHVTIGILQNGTEKEKT
jgi:hypothetical protein